jgi:uncharacterized membrane protein (GlpM family)
MDPFWASLLAKMIASAAVVVAASFVVERAGPFLGAMVAMLPVSAGPAYVFLAMEHGPAFIEASSLTSLAVNAATIVFIATYAALAQRRSLLVSLSGALLVWLAGAWCIMGLPWTLPKAVTLNVVVMAVCIAASRRAFTDETAVVGGTKKLWWALPARALGVMVLSGAVVLAGRFLGPSVAGLTALAPVILTSLVLILHPRMGGPATARVLVHGLPAMLGFTLALATIYTTATAMGSAASLTCALIICIVWNVGLVLWRRSQARSA